MVDRISDINTAPTLFEAGSVPSVDSTYNSPTKDFRAVLGNAALFSNQLTDYLLSSDDFFRFKGEVTRAICFWADEDSGGNASAIMGVWDSDGNQRSWVFFGDYSFSISADGTTLINGVADGASGDTLSWGALDWSGFSQTGPFANEMNFIVGYYDAVNKEVGYSMNARPFATRPHTGGFFGNTTAQFRIGNVVSQRVSPVQGMEGVLDNFFILTFIPTQEDLDFLYNNGNGRSYGEWIARVGTGGAFQTDGFWYSMDETDGDRADSVEGNAALVQTGVVNSAVGRLGNAAAFIGNAASYLSSDNDGLKLAASFHIIFWLYLNDLDDQEILGRYDASSNQRSYFFAINGGSLEFRVSVDGISETIVTASDIVQSQWMMIDGFYKGQTNEIGVAINADRHDEATHAGGAFGGSVAFYVGRDAQGINGLDGRVDNLVILNQVLVESDRAFLYNSGNARSFAEWQVYKSISTDALVNLPSTEIEKVRLSAFLAAEGQAYTPQEVLSEVVKFDWFDFFPVNDNLQTVGKAADPGETVISATSTTNSKQLTATTPALKTSTGINAEDAHYTLATEQHINQILIVVGSNAIAASDSTVLDMSNASGDAGALNRKFAIYGSSPTPNSMSFQDDANGWSTSGGVLDNSPMIYTWAITGAAISFQEDGAEVGTGVVTTQGASAVTVNDVSWLNANDGLSPSKMNVQGILHVATDQAINLEMVHRFLTEYYLNSSAAVTAAWFDMDETAGDRANEAPRGLSLLQRGVVSFQTGIGPSAARFNGNDQNYLASTETFLRPGKETRYFSCFVKMNRLDVRQTIFGVHGDAGEISYVLQFKPAPNRFEWIVSSDGTNFSTTTTFQIPNSPPVATPGNLYQLSAYYDAVNGYIAISINNSDLVVQFHADGFYRQSAANFVVGRLDTETEPSYPLDGGVEKLIVLDFIPNQADLDFLYNNGSSRTYSEWQTRQLSAVEIVTPPMTATLSAAAFPNFNADNLAKAQTAAQTAAAAANVAAGQVIYTPQDVIDELAKGIWYEAQDNLNMYTTEDGNVNPGFNGPVKRMRSITTSDEIRLFQATSEGGFYTTTAPTRTFFVKDNQDFQPDYGLESDRFVGVMQAAPYMTLIVAGGGMMASFTDPNFPVYSTETMLHLTRDITVNSRLGITFNVSSGAFNANVAEVGNNPSRLFFGRGITFDSDNSSSQMSDVEHDTRARVATWDINNDTLRFRHNSLTETIIVHDDDLRPGDPFYGDANVIPSSRETLEAMFFGSKISQTTDPPGNPGSRAEWNGSLYGFYYATADNAAGDVNVELVERFFNAFYDFKVN